MKLFNISITQYEMVPRGRNLKLLVINKYYIKQSFKLLHKRSQHLFFN